MPTTTRTRSTRAALVERPQNQADVQAQGQARRRQQQQQQQQQHHSGRFPPVAVARQRPGVGRNGSGGGHPHAHILAGETRTSQENITAQHTKSARMKRPIDFITTHRDPLKAKRARISIELPALSKTQLIQSPKTVTVRASSPPPVSLEPTVAKVVVATQQQQQNKQKPPPPSRPTPIPKTQTTTSRPTTNLAADTQKAPTNHHKKVANGLRHELDRLQPTVADAGPAKEQGRKLRSQEATRFKSELSAYFPDYDEVIGNDAKEHHLLNVETPILIIDSRTIPTQVDPNIRLLPTRQAAVATSHSQAAHHQPNTSHRRTNSLRVSLEDYPIRSYGDALFTELWESQRIDFPSLDLKSSSNDELVDPLPDSHYETAHKKAERLEKSIRNTERGRAQHERDQIIRLLGELQGHDWLRTMGVNGVTESRKKTFEPARDHFVKGCQAIIDKFRWWSAEEKKRKLEREQALADEDSSADSEEEVEDDEELEAEEPEAEELEDVQMASNDEEMVDAASEHDIPDYMTDGDPPDLSDVDASVTKQLHDEALARVRATAAQHLKRSRGEPLSSPDPPVVLREFKSFFLKRHERNAALSVPRRTRRAVMAWGHDIPDPPEDEFSLDEEYRDEEFMRRRERRKRRVRRGSKP